MSRLTTKPRRAAQRRRAGYGFPHLCADGLMRTTMTPRFIAGGMQRRALVNMCLQQGWRP